MHGNRYAIALLIALTLGLNGCSSGFWGSDNKVDKHPLAKFGQKKVLDEARDRGEMALDNPYAGQSAEDSTFLFGDKDGVLGGGGGKTEEDIRREKLYAGALQVVMALPIKVADGNGGFVATDWKVDPNRPDVRYRLNILVTGTKPYGTVKVVVLKQLQTANGWQDSPSDQELAKQIAKAIRKSSHPVQLQP
ncbi:conserved hypothetical protein [Magnetococcus marinus MC-1]|uniref:Uncharacterized protein n=1 Tax=Magnetococcus marinus (strain ATCC BAA-1437 / JCM 17883 / MC-1) TaxID=156889 RepID=A0LE40_MAGMM|nr:DUF3576 domain-containing protein [Magnetococcus marinus]ABK46233.1 conserved hypothetical protein [Magnetococcus marinus MC-1]